MIKEINGNILYSKFGVIAEVLNCQCRQKSGVALAIKEAYPEIETEDNRTIRGDRSKMGNLCVAKIEDTPNEEKLIQYVVGIYAQEFYGTEKRQLDYEAFYQGLQKLRRFCEPKNLTIAMPHGIGCCRAGGSWQIVEAMVKDVFEDYPNDVFICKL